MKTDKLIEKEKKFSAYEFQVKIKADISPEKLSKLGARELGCVVHEDIYYVREGKNIEDSELLRIRREGGEKLIFIYKANIKKTGRERFEIKKVIKKPINEAEMKELIKGYRRVVHVNKQRIIFFYNHIIVNIDHVEGLGNFIEFVADSDRHNSTIKALMKNLGLEGEKILTHSYFELAVTNLDTFQRIFMALHEKFGKWTFGISSAVLTTLGMIVGLNSATSSRLAVLAGIAAVAIADSLSDSLGMYSQKKAERGTSSKTAFNYAWGCFLGKFIFTFSFMIPFLLLPIEPAILISVIWGLMLISFVNAQIAFIQEENITWGVTKSIIITLIVVLLSYLAGKAIDILFS